MIKLVILVIIIASVAAFGFYYFRTQRPVPDNQTLITSEKLATSSAALSNRIAQATSSAERLVIVEEALVDALAQIDQLKSSPVPTSQFESRLKTLEGKVDALQKSANTTTQTTTVTQASSNTKKSPIYIPFGSTATSGDRNFISIDYFEVSLDPADYEGYTSMQLELSLKLAESVGVAYARLYNQTDQAATSSELSTTSDKYVLLTSSGFRLPVGRKNYRLQLKSTEGYDATVANARIKVNF